MENTCALCGSNDVHACGDDFLCDICCTNIMGIPDELPYLFNWLSFRMLFQLNKENNYDSFCC